MCCSRIAGVLPVLLSLSMCAQQAEPKPLTPEMLELQGRMRAAFYHPGEVSLSCDAAPDFTNMVATLGPDSKDALKAFEGIRMHVSSANNGMTDVQLTWPSKAANAELGDGIKQMVVGFFRSYWASVNGELLPEAKDKPVLTKQADGSYLVTEQKQGKTVVLTVGADALVRHVETRSPGAASTTDLTYTPTASGVMRLSGMKVSQQTGASRIGGTMMWTDQNVNGVWIPERVIIGIPGAFELPVMLSKCSVTKAVK